MVGDISRKTPSGISVPENYAIVRWLKSQVLKRNGHDIYDCDKFMFGKSDTSKKIRYVKIDFSVKYICI